MKQSFIYIRQSYTELHDKFVDLGGSGTNYTFYTIQRSKDISSDPTTTLAGVRSIVSVQFRLEGNVDTYYRQVYTLLSLLGDVGGI
jgi:hypothetical protein